MYTDYSGMYISESDLLSCFVPAEPVIFGHQLCSHGACGLCDTMRLYHYFTRNRKDGSRWQGLFAGTDCKNVMDYYFIAHQKMQ